MCGWVGFWVGGERKKVRRGWRGGLMTMEETRKRGNEETRNGGMGWVRERDDGGGSSSSSSRSSSYY